MPAFNEEGAIGGVVEGIRASTRRSTSSSSTTARPDGTAASHARPAPQWSGSRTTSASARRCRRGSSTRSSAATSIAVRLDGDGQHDPPSCRSCSGRSTRARPTSSRAPGSSTATAATGRRSPGGSGSSGSRGSSRCSPRQRVTDTTSGFQALNRNGIALFADDYPSDYPEVEATVLVFSTAAAARRGAGDACASASTAVVDHLRPLDLLRAQGDARAVRRHGRASTPCPPEEMRTGDSRPDLDRGRGRVAPADPHRARADPRPAPQGALRAAVARDGRRAARALALARRASTRSPAGSASPDYPPAILFAVAILFVIVVLLHYSTVLSKLDDESTPARAGGRDPACRVDELEGVIADPRHLGATGGSSRT